jgi:uroporphyrinogen-III synthase
MKTILSTKILTQEQKQPLENAHIQLTEYAAIDIDFVEFDGDIIVENAIITSQNAAKAIIDKKVLIRHCFCVGEKTQAFLEEYGQNVIKMTHYAEELAKIIQKKYKNEHFTFFCGNLRRDTIPEALKTNHISFIEIEVYKTTLNPQAIEGAFDGVLFFSPSCVESYVAKNNLEQQIAFCIGETTAEEVKKYSKNSVIASHPTIESVLEKVVKYLR